MGVLCGRVLHSLEETKSTPFLWINELIMSELRDNFSWKKVFAVFPELTS